jgi:hypothetical protein
MARFLAPALLVLALTATGCAGGGESEPRWTAREAASITTVRSMPVRVVRCHGLGEAEEHSFTRFDCLAGTRAPWETYDTIAVTYVLRPLAEFDGPRSRHGLSRVRFIGGPGIP